MTPDRLKAAHEIVTALEQRGEIFRASVVRELISYAMPPQPGRLFERRPPLLMDQKPTRIELED